MFAGFSKFYRSSYPLSLERSLITRIREEKKSDPLKKIWVLVPNHYIGGHLKHELALTQSHIQVKFSSMEELAVHLLNSHKIFLQRKKLTPEMEIHLIKEICKKELEGSEFKDVCNKRGFHKNLKNFFHHLISEESNQIPRFNKKTKVFDSIFSSYLKLKKNYHHTLWNLELASKTIIEMDDPIFVYGFSSLTKLERSFLYQIAQVTSLSVWMEVFTIENFQIPTLNWMDHHFKHVEDLPEQEKVASISLQSCHHLQDESIWIAKSIADRQKTNPIPFHKFGIFLNDYAGQKIHIETALNQTGIPYVVLHGTTVAKSRLGQSVTRLLELLTTNWSRNQWFDFLRTFPFDASWFEKNGNPSDWNQFSVDADISTKQAFYFERLELLYARTKNEMIAAFISFQRKILNDVSDMESSIQNKNFLKLSQQLNSFCQNYANLDTLTDATLQFFDELEYLFSDSNTQFDWVDAQRIIQEKIERTIEKNAVFESDGVLVAPFSMMKSLFFDTIFLPHMNEGYFPKHESPLFDLHVDELKQISDQSKISFDQNQKHLDIQSSILDSAKYHASNAVLLSYSMYSLPKEEDLKPSILVQPWISKEQIFDSSSWNLSSQNANPSTREQIRQWVNSEQSNEWTSFNAYADPKNFKRDIYSATEISKYATCPKKYFLAHILGLSIEEYLEDEVHMMSKDKGTLIHTILFRFFMSLKEKGLLPIKRGNRDLMLELLTQVSTETFKQHQTFHSYGIPDLWNLDENELLSDLTAYLDHEIEESSYWQPHSFEHRFGMKKIEGQEDDPHSFEKPIPLYINEKSLLFKGKVDRIDLSPDGQQMRIIDYKTSKFDRKSWGYGKGTNLQIPLYLLLSNHFFSQKPTHVEGKLVSLQAISKFEELKIDQNQLSVKQNELSNHFKMIDTGIQSGAFFPNPESGGSNCKFCDFQRLCGKNIHQTLENIEPTDFMNHYFESKKALP